MSINAVSAVAAMAIGIGATLTIDLWNLFLKRAFGMPSLSYCLLGRWCRHMLEGTFRHVSIAAALPKLRECTVGWIVHYTIGAVLALVFVAVMSGDWLARPTLLPALLYGIGTVVFPFFILQPAFGLGIASSKTAAPTQARLKKSCHPHRVRSRAVSICTGSTACAEHRSPSRAKRPPMIS